MTHFFAVLILITPLSDARSLTDIVCTIKPENCYSFKKNIITNPAIRRSYSTSNSFGSPSSKEFLRWNSYEETAQGTGFSSHTESGAKPVPYGPGLGNIGITTGIGIQHPFGGLGIQRDFGISTGGSGRIGGFPVGWGNGDTMTIGAAPWAHP